VVLQNGVRCPPGTFFWLSIISLHLSPFNYVDPYRFWPERWQQGASAEGQVAAAGAAAAAAAAAAAGAAGAAQPADAAAAEARGGGGGCPFGFGSGRATPAGNSAAPRQSFMPFAIGNNDCIGQGLANVVGKAMLAMLCSRFQFEVAPRMGSPEDVYAAEVIRLTLQPGEGVWLLLSPRDGGAAGAEQGVGAASAAAANRMAVGASA
jgi:cytochrome P450